MCASVHAGKVLYYFLVSWLYALYSFDYRWGLSHKHLQQRVAFFQQHWAFFLGGLPACLLPGAGLGCGLHFPSLDTMLCKALWHCILVLLSLCLQMDRIHFPFMPCLRQTESQLRTFQGHTQDLSNSMDTGNKKGRKPQS